MLMLVLIQFIIIIMIKYTDFVVGANKKLNEAMTNKFAVCV